MRHRVKGRKLSRTASHRRATMRALATALLISPDKRIVTTVEKAKELRVFIEPLITRAKVDNQVNRSTVFSVLQHKEAVKIIFSEVGPKSEGRPGGYTRILKLDFRKGDGAEKALIELVDFHTEAEPKKAKAKKTRRAGKGKATTTPASKPAKSDAAKESETTTVAEEDTTAVEAVEAAEPVVETPEEKAEEVAEEVKDETTVSDDEEKDSESEEKKSE